jgi:hypothetical protein
MLDSRAFVVAAVPAAVLVVGLLAVPRPQGVEAAQRSFDRSALGSAVSTTPTAAQQTFEVKLGSAITIRGADLPTLAVSRGARVPLKLHFAVDAALPDDWQVFVHIDADEGGFRIHGDHWPVRGSYRTTLWQRGEFIVDSFDVIVPAAAPAGTYSVWVGLYRGDDRLPFTGGDPARHDGDHRIKAGVLVIE